MRFSNEGAPNIQAHGIGCGMDSQACSGVHGRGGRGNGPPKSHGTVGRFQRAL